MEDKIRIIEVKRSIFADNDADAERLRQELKEKKVFLLNLMSSPGSGKTTTLLALAKALEGRIKMGVMEADIDSAVDAETMTKAGVKSIQIHTGGMCHLDADMTRQGLYEFGLDRRGVGDTGKCGQSGLSGGVRHRSCEKYDNPVRT